MKNEIQCRKCSEAFVRCGLHERLEAGSDKKCCGCCCKKITFPKIPLGEKRAKITILNPTKLEVTKIKVDICRMLDEQNQLRCDYLLLSNDLEVFVELKSGRPTIAVEQLQASIKLLSNKKVVKNVKVKAIVVAGDFSNHTENVGIESSIKKFKKNYGASLKYFKSGETLPLDNL